MSGSTDSASLRVVGAGIAGAWCALLAARAGIRVDVFESDSSYEEDSSPRRGCSYYAGGMIAPGCESDVADAPIPELGRRSLELWRRHGSEACVFRGSLAVAHSRDVAELERFASRTEGGRRVGEEEIAVLEPDLAGRFAHGVFFADEAHAPPRLALRTLCAKASSSGARFHWRRELDPRLAADDGGATILDARGLFAAEAWEGRLRGVRGEAIRLADAPTSISRPIRLLHPRHPIYVAPHDGGCLYVGATSVEGGGAEGRVSARSALELLSSAYALHPSLGEGTIAEMISRDRPALRDHRPRLERRGRHFALNGLHRHGFLASAALAESFVSAFLGRGEEAGHASATQRALARA